MADIAKVLRGIERCKKCTFPNTLDPEGTKAYLECEYTIGLYCGRDTLERQMEELLKEQNQRIWELLTEKEKLEEKITDLEDTIRQLNQHMKDLSKYMTPYGMVKDIKAYVELLKEQKPVQCKDCAYALFKEGVQPGHVVCTKPFTERWQTVKPDNWFCADGLVKDNCSEFPNN